MTHLGTQLTDIEPTLLAVILSACSAQSLLRLEVALGARVGLELRSHSAYHRGWIQALRSEGGLWILGAKGRPDLGGPPQRLFVSSCKAALRTAWDSVALDAGWCFASWADFEASVAALARFHAQFVDGREVRDPATCTLRGHVRRVSLVHFDVDGCFADDSWAKLVACFRNGTPLPVSTSVRACSNARVHHFDGGYAVPLFLELCGFNGEGPEDAFYIDICFDSFASYFSRSSRTSSVGWPEVEFLHVRCLLRCGSVERTSGVILASDAYRTFHQIDYKHFWHFSSWGNSMGHHLSLEVLPGDGDAFILDENLHTAQWNMSLSEGTELVPLVSLSDNEFAAVPFARGALEGAIALIRRGGNCGFAQKTIAARDAGAVGCVIYELEGDRDALGVSTTMGQRFQGHDFPDPGIPSVLVHANVGQRLLALATAPGGTRARINVDPSPEALRRLNVDFEAFRLNVARGEPVHLAVVVESVDVEPGVREDFDLDGKLSWFEPSTLRRPAGPMPALSDTSYISIGTVQIVGPL